MVQEYVVSPILHNVEIPKGMDYVVHSNICGPQDDTVEKATHIPQHSIVQYWRSKREQR